MKCYSSISQETIINNHKDDLRKVSDAVISTVNKLKLSGISLLKKVPDLYYDPDDCSSVGLFPTRLMMIRAKRTSTDGASAFSTSCTSTSHGSESESNSTLSTRPSMTIANVPTQSFGTRTTAAAIIEPNTPQSMGPIIMINKDKQGQPREVVFEAATHFGSPQTVIDEDDFYKKQLDYDTDDDEDTSFGQDSAEPRRLSLMWDEAQAVARRGVNMDLERLSSKEGESHPLSFQLPEGVTRDDIMVTIDIDDTARSSILSPNDEALGKQVMPHNHCTIDSISSIGAGHASPHKSSGKRHAFEQAVEQGILEDLKSIYTARPDTAKLVLCIVICILSDGSLQHTSRVGGRVGLCELALNWRLFGADDLKVYEGGLTVQRKDFGFGPLELTEAEGEYYVLSHMAPRAADDIVRRIGGANQDFLAEI
jgi:hypothetical protein